MTTESFCIAPHCTQGGGHAVRLPPRASSRIVAAHLVHGLVTPWRHISPRRVSGMDLNGPICPRRRDHISLDAMRILVTGGVGFIGSHLCERLLSERDEVICLDNFFTGSRENMRSLVGHYNFEVLRHDINTP